MFFRSVDDCEDGNGKTRNLAPMLVEPFCPCLSNGIVLRRRLREISAIDGPRPTSDVTRFGWIFSDSEDFLTAKECAEFDETWQECRRGSEVHQYRAASCSAVGALFGGRKTVKKRVFRGFSAFYDLLCEFWMKTDSILSICVRLPFF